MNADTASNVDPVAGKVFADFLLSDAAQDVIGMSGRPTYGEPRFVPAAGLADADVTERE